MSSHELESHRLWLEFDGPGVEHAVSDAFSFVRFVADRIEGGQQRELIASLREDRWLLVSHQFMSFSRISGLGVLSVHLEHFDRRELVIECTQVQMNGTLLIVDDWAMALFEPTRAAWIRLGTGARLQGIRMESDAAARRVASQGRSGYARPLSRAA
jgi:hypothetical protein